MTPSERFDWGVANPVDFEQARRFLSALGSNHTYQTFDDTKDRKLGSLIKVINGDAGDEVMEKLFNLNAEGAGIFVTVNQTDGKGRRRNNIVGARAIYADFDGDDAIAKFEAAAALLPPSIVVASSPNKRHAYWLCPTTAEEAEDMQWKMPEAVGCDEDAKDVTRVLRVPGFYHRKAEPVQTILLECDTNITYEPWEIISAFNLDDFAGKPKKKEKKSPAKGTESTQEPRSAPSGYDPLDYAINERDEALVRSALRYVDAKQRRNWIAVAGALSRCGVIGERIFCEWSATAGESGGYRGDDDCIAKLREMEGNAASNFPAIFTLAAGMGWHRNEDAATDVEIEDDDDAYEIKLKATEYLIDGVLDTGVTYIAGAQGVGKTSMLVALCSIASGELDAFDEGLLVTLPRHVIYVCEDKGQVDKIRYALMHEKGMKNKRRFLSVQSTRRINEEAIRNLLGKYVPKYTIEGPNGYPIKPLIVFDTSNACFDIESENDSSQVGRIMSALKSQLSPVIVVGHLAKTLNRAEFGMLSGRGSGAWEGDAQATGFIFKEEDGPDSDRHFGLKKVRFEPDFRELRFTTEVMTVTIDTPWGTTQTERIRYGVPTRSSASDRMGDKEVRKNEERESKQRECERAVRSLLSAAGVMFKAEIIEALTLEHKRDPVRAAIGRLLETKVVVEVTKLDLLGREKPALQLAPPLSFDDA